MRILHIVEDFSLASGGLRTVVSDLHKNLFEKAHQSYILSSKKEIEDDIFLVETDSPWLYSKKWIKKLKLLKQQNLFDIIHIHGVWLYPQYIAAKFCVKNNIPFLLSVHGMYEPWLWTKGTLKKHFYFNFFAKKYFSKANAIHSITMDEKINLKELFPNTKLIEIPNLIEIPKSEEHLSINEDGKYFLYLGRLDEKKGIDLLIKSFSLFKEKFILIIAGSYNDYKRKLESIVKSLDLNDKVQFRGFVKGNEKIELIKNSWILVAPSYSEVVGMVNLEAGSLKTPVITTFQTGIKKEWNENGGMLINPELKELETAMSKAASWTLKERNENGNKLHKFVLENYSWSNKMDTWIQIYETSLKNV